MPMDGGQDTTTDFSRLSLMRSSDLMNVKGGAEGREGSGGSSNTTTTSNNGSASESRHKAITTIQRAVRAADSLGRLADAAGASASRSGGGGDSASNTVRCHNDVAGSASAITEHLHDVLNAVLSIADSQHINLKHAIQYRIRSHTFQSYSVHASVKPSHPLLDGVGHSNSIDVADATAAVCSEKKNHESANSVVANMSHVTDAFSPLKTQQQSELSATCPDMVDVSPFLSHEISSPSFRCADDVGQSLEWPASSAFLSSSLTKGLRHDNMEDETTAMASARAVGESTYSVSSESAAVTRRNDDGDGSQTVSTAVPSTHTGLEPASSTPYDVRVAHLDATVHSGDEGNTSISSGIGNESHSVGLCENHGHLDGLPMCENGPPDTKRTYRNIYHPVKHETTVLPYGLLLLQQLLQER